MRKLSATILALMLSTVTFAQNRVFCEIVEQAISFKKSTKVTIDFGQKREKALRKQSMVDENGNNLIFNSKIDALNHMIKLGWEFLQVAMVIAKARYIGYSTKMWRVARIHTKASQPRRYTTKPKSSKPHLCSQPGYRFRYPYSGRDISSFDGYRKRYPSFCIVLGIKPNYP